MILLDTNVCVGILRGDPKVLAEYSRAAGNVAVAAMTEGELFYGAECSGNSEGNRNLVGRFLNAIPVVHTSDDIMRRFALEKGALRKRGVLVDDADVLIAATAMAMDCPLATRNIRHFSRFPALVLENWFGD